MAKTSFSSLFAADSGTVLAGFTFQNEAMAAALAKAKEAKTQRVAENAAMLFEAVDKHNNVFLNELRRLRKAEKVAKDRLDTFKEAVQYFLDSGNFGPLYPFMPCEVQRTCSVLGVDTPTADEQKVPK